MSKPAETIVILGGGLVKDKDGLFKTVGFNQGGDRSGITGDRLRIEAGYWLWGENPDRFIIASGGQGFLDHLGEHPNICSVIKKELIELGVPAEKIIEESKSNSTYQQLCSLKDLLSLQGITDIIVVTNRWHLPRTKQMIDSLDGIKDFYKKLRVKYLTAEQVLVKNYPEKWRQIVDEAYASLAMRERLKLEEQGIKQIKNGTYQYE